MTSPRDMAGMIIYLPPPQGWSCGTQRYLKEAHTDSQERLPEYHVKARNTSSSSENKIHDEQIARQYGFRGALVPGVTVYAYLTHPLVEAFGAAWLERGTANVRFVKPIHDGEEVRLAGVVTSRDARGLTATVTATTAVGGECATLTATLPAGPPVPVNLAQYPVAPLPSDRPPATRAHLAGLAALGTPVNPYDEERQAEYLDRVSDSLALYRGARGWVHPGFFLDQANKALSQNVRMSPWIHVGSVVRHLGGARVGEILSTRGRVRSLFEKKGREFVEADLVLVAGERRPIAHVLHTAIYRLPAPAR
jgi:acyl dehydratase